MRERERVVIARLAVSLHLGMRSLRILTPRHHQSVYGPPYLMRMGCPTTSPPRPAPPTRTARRRGKKTSGTLKASAPLRHPTVFQQEETTAVLGPPKPQITEAPFRFPFPFHIIVGPSVPARHGPAFDLPGSREAGEVSRPLLVLRRDRFKRKEIQKERGEGMGGLGQRMGDRKVIARVKRCVGNCFPRHLCVL